MFDGIPQDLPKFMAQLHLKLHDNASLFPTEIFPLSYTVSLLEKNYFAQVQGYIKKNTINLADIKALIKTLEDDIRHQDSIGTAKSSLCSLEQRTSDFSGYMAVYNRLAGKVK